MSNHLSFEDFTKLQNYIADAPRSLKEVIYIEFSPDGLLSKYDPEEEINFQGFNTFITLYLGVDFPHNIRENFFLHFNHRCKKPGYCNNVSHSTSDISSILASSLINAITDNVAKFNIHKYDRYFYLSKHELDVLKGSRYKSHVKGKSLRKRRYSISEGVPIVDCFITDSDTVMMKDILCYFGLLESGKPEEKLEFVFRLYDCDGNGVLDKTEINCIINQMMNVANYLKWDTSELRPILIDMMKSMDYDRDGEVSLKEWKLAGMTNTPLLVLLGLDADVREDGRHVFAFKHFRSHAFCNFCRKILGNFGSQGLSCKFCKYTVHERCSQQAPCNCIYTYSKCKLIDHAMLHHWIEASIPSMRNSCSKCKKHVGYIGSKTEGVHCRWCRSTVHKNCISSFKVKCDFGDMAEHVLPPNYIYPSVFERKLMAPIAPTESSSCTLKSNSESLSNSEEHIAFVKENDETLKPKSYVGQCSFQISSMKNSVPLLIFINPKSGGRQGKRLLEKLQLLLNPRQVFNLVADGGPYKGLNFFQNIYPFKILVCGGDGTVGWLLEAMDDFFWPHGEPPVAVLPLGTGNDLSRVLNWGGGYENGDLSYIISQISESTIVKMDRWKIVCSKSTAIETYYDSTKKYPLNNTTSSLARTNEINKKSDPYPIYKKHRFGDIEVGEQMPLNIINNYFSVGVDASIAHKFHVMREKYPEKFCSRMRNRFLYMEYGTSEVISATCKNLQDFVDIICDGVALDLKSKTTGGHISFEGLSVLNITSIYGGSNLWGKFDDDSGDNRKDSSISQESSATSSSNPTTSSANPTTSTAINRPRALTYSSSFLSRSRMLKKYLKKKLSFGRFDVNNHRESSEFIPDIPFCKQDMGDQRLEIVGVQNAIHAGLVAGRIKNSGIRLAQCTEVVIRTKKRLPMQIDGEPWIQLPCTIVINHKNQVSMLNADVDKKRGFFSFMR